MNNPGPGEYDTSIKDGFGRKDSKDSSNSPKRHDSIGKLPGISISK